MGGERSHREPKEGPTLGTGERGVGDASGGQNGGSSPLPVSRSQQPPTSERAHSWIGEVRKAIPGDAKNCNEGYSFLAVILV